MATRNHPKRISVTTAIVAERVGVSKSTVVQYITAGLLKAYRLPSGHYRVLHEDLDEFVKSLRYLPAKDSRNIL